MRRNKSITKEQADFSKEIVMAQNLEEARRHQREYISRAVHCLEYFEERHQTQKIRFWANQCAEDLRRLC